mgnify:CR=1 FL=1
MTTLTLTPDPTYGRMRVIVQDGEGGTLTRDGDPVRGAAAVWGDRIVDDYECPLDVQVTYVLEDGSATGTLASTGLGGYLSHPTDPTLLMGPVTVESDDDWQWTAPGTAHPVLGASAPVVTHSLRTIHEGTLELLIPYADRDALKALLVTGSPLLLRVPAACPVDDMWFWPEVAGRTWLAPQPSAGGLLRFTLDYQKVAKPGGEVTQDPSNSWSAVTVTHPTWTDLTTSHATWLDVLVTAHPH